jgi:hypothetical protein
MSTFFDKEKRQKVIYGATITSDSAFVRLAGFDPFDPSGRLSLQPASFWP